MHGSVATWRDFSSSHGLLIFVTAPREYSMADAFSEVDIVQKAAADQHGDAPRIIWGLGFHDSGVVNVCLVALK